MAVDAVVAVDVVAVFIPAWNNQKELVSLNNVAVVVAVDAVITVTAVLVPDCNIH